jgi:hypothetical protein
VVKNGLNHSDDFGNKPIDYSDFTSFNQFNANGHTDTIFKDTDLTFDNFDTAQDVFANKNTSMTDSQPETPQKAPTRQSQPSISALNTNNPFGQPSLQTLPQHSTKSDKAIPKNFQNGNSGNAQQ